MLKQLLLLKAGDVQPPLRTTHGDYDRWFIRALSGHCHLEVLNVPAGGKLPSADAFDAVIMTGSPLSVTEPAPWMRAASDYLFNVAEHRHPVLGVCFGHQLLGNALGARVIRNPRGREIGTVEVALTREGKEDPLFRGLPQHFGVQATHEDILADLPQGAVLLASNDNTPHQALALGPRIRTVQFHPELDAPTMTSLIASRRAKLEGESTLPSGERIRTLLAGVRPTPAGAVLRNFLDYF